MPILTTFKNTIVGLLRKDEREREMTEELESYVELLTEENVRAGMDAESARREALMEVGGVEQVKAAVRETQHGALLDTIIQDLRFAARMLRKSPGFTAVIVLTLALGIGANIALFSTINAVLIRRIPFDDPGRLVAANKGRDGVPMGPVSRLDYFDYADRATSFDGLAAYVSGRATLTGDGSPEVVGVMFATWNLLPVLGVDPILGRHLLREEEVEGGSTSALISHDLWQRRFGGDPDVVGRTLHVDGLARTVVGVLPPGFRFMADADVWLAVERGDFFIDRQRDAHSHWLVGRLKKGVTIAQAQREVDAISARLEALYPETNKAKGLVLFDLQRYMVGSARTSLLLLMATTAMVLLIACGNVAGLLLARGQQRMAEMAMRTALGAARQRLVRQLVTESVLHALLAGLAGVAVALAFQRLLLRLLPLGRPGLPEPSIDAPVLFFAVALSILVGAVVGVMPAIRGTSFQPWLQLKTATNMSETGSSSRLRNMLVVVQVAVSVTLLVGTGLLILTMANLMDVKLGFDPGHLLAGTVGIQESAYETEEARAEFFSSLVERVEALPAVVSAATISKLPIASPSTDWPIWHADEPRPAMVDARLALARWATPGYFETMGIPLLRGRDIASSDRPESPRVLVISEAAARGLFADEDPIGRTVKLGWTDDTWEIVGVVGDACLESLDSTFDWAMYMPSAQMGSTHQWLVVRSTGDPALLESPVRRILREMNPDVVFSGPRTMTAVIDSSLEGFRTIMVALGLLAGVALLLTAVGLYGVLSYHVSQRSNEFGIRLALGAPTESLLKLVLTRGFQMVGTGIVLGLAGSLVGTRLVEQLLYGTYRLDPLAFAGSAAFLSGVAFVACVLPAWRATRISPVKVLRRE